MAVVGSILQEIIKRRTQVGPRVQKTPLEHQARALKKLLRRAKDTSFGKVYKFDQILNSKNPIEEFQKRVPIHDYNKMYEKWWFRTVNGEPDVCWPGKIDKFALSSGTSGAPSKQIPVTKSMIRKMRRASIRQMLSLGQHNLPATFYESSILGVGGTTKLKQEGDIQQGDVSGILSGNIPSWFSRFYRPEKPVLEEGDWEKKINMMVENAPNWNIGIVAGLPSWIQILFQKIIDKYELETIHDIWPDFRFLVHGGMAFGPYKNTINELLGKPVDFLETYMASEGFIAFSTGLGSDLKLLLNNGIFFEFVPFNNENFNADNEIVENPTVLSIDQVEEGVDYAILLSTCAGAWRYLIGDTIQFLSKENGELIITGRTKHFISLCGEHLSVDNMDQAIVSASQELGIKIPEYTVTGFKHQNLFAHKWFVGTNDAVDKEQLIKLIDQKLKELNDDYITERNSAIPYLFIETIPVEAFFDFLKHIKKQGGQVKFPKVLKGEMYNKWDNFLKEEKYIG